MSVKAIAKSVRMSPRKVGVVAGLVKGRTVNDALTILENTPRFAAEPLIKAIKSARANADYNHRLKPDTLIIESIQVTPGIRYKRFRPVSRGMAHPYQKRTSNITVIVNGEERPARTRNAAAESAQPAAAAPKAASTARVRTTKKEKK